MARYLSIEGRLSYIQFVQRTISVKPDHINQDKKKAYRIIYKL